MHSKTFNLLIHSVSDLDTSPRAPYITYKYTTGTKNQHPRITKNKKKSCARHARRTYANIIQPRRADSISFPSHVYTNYSSTTPMKKRRDADQHARPYLRHSTPLSLHAEFSPRLRDFRLCDSYSLGGRKNARRRRRRGFATTTTRLGGINGNLVFSYHPCRAILSLSLS